MTSPLQRVPRTNLVAITNCASTDATPRFPSLRLASLRHLTTPLAPAPDHMRIFALDEADEMLSRGFKDQIYDVFKFLPENVQCCLFSATMPLDILEITTRFMRGMLWAMMDR